MKRGTPRHPKVAHLRELLKLTLAAAVGYLELLWHFTAEFCPQGDIGRYDDARIEAGLSWPGARGKLVAALIEAHWIDHHRVCRLVVHDWHDHADGAVIKRLQRSNLPFLSITEKVTEQRQPAADNGGLPDPIQSDPILAMPEPNHSDDSDALSKPGSKTTEFAADCLIPKDGRTGLTPIRDLASTVQDVQKLRAEMKAIRGQEPSQTAVVNVRTALGDCPVSGFVEHLRGIDQRYRPGGHRAVATWKWFESTAKSYAEAEAQAKPQGAPGSDQCRHGGLADGQCPQCLPRADFEASLDRL